MVLMAQAEFAVLQRSSAQETQQLTSALTKVEAQLTEVLMQASQPASAPSHAALQTESLQPQCHAHFCLYRPGGEG